MLSIEPDVMTRLAHVIKTGINTLEPHGGPRGPGPFGGSYDWHSCVHAHWTLLAMERFGMPVDDWLHVRLSSSVLETEYKYLQDNPSFEILEIVECALRADKERRWVSVSDVR